MAIAFQYKSPASAAPFQRDIDNLIEIFFSGANKEDRGPFTVIGEGRISTALDNALPDINPRTQNDAMTEHSLLQQQYKQVIFVSPIAENLEFASQKTGLKPYEVAIFLVDSESEDYEPSLNSDFSEEIIIGEEIQNILFDFLRQNINGGFDFLKALEEDFGFDPQSATTNLLTLIKSGRLKNAGQSFCLNLFKALDAFNLFIAEIYINIGDFLLGLIKKADRITFQPEHWNPEAVGGDHNFSPVLFPLTHELIDFSSPYNEEAVAIVSNKLAEEIKEYSNNELTYINGLSRAKGNTVLPDYILNFSRVSTESLTNISLMLIGTIDRLAPHIGPMTKQGLNMINAFYCGLWNSLVKVVLGPLGIAAHLIKGSGLTLKASQNIRVHANETLEPINILCQLMINVAWDLIIKKVLDIIVKEVLKIDLAVFTSIFSLEKAAYFYGACVGFVVEMIIGFFTSTGILSNILLAIKPFGKLGEGLYSFIKSEIESFTGLREGFSVEGMKAIVQKLNSLLEADGQGLSDLIERLFAELKPHFKTYDEMIL